MRKLSCLLVAASALYLVACEKGGFSYEDVNTEDGAGYILLDTFSVDVKTVLLDSIPSSGQGVILNGHYNDPYFGKITAGSFFEVSMPADHTIENNMVYDSLELVLAPNGYYYGDTSIPVSMSVYQLAQNIKLADNEVYLYTHNTFATQSQALGSATAYIRPSMHDTVHVKLADSKGQELWSLFANNGNEVSGAEQFLDYFKGLAIKPGNTNAIYGFEANTTGTIMRLHYHINSLERETKYFDFPLSAPANQFNHVQTDRTGTPLSALSLTNNNIPSTNMDNTAYVLGLTGVVARIDLPSIKKLPELGRYGKIISASLVVPAIRGTYTKTDLPEKLTLVQADAKNVPYDTLVDGTTGGYQYGNLSIDNLYNENTNYTFDLTTFCNAQINTDNLNARGLLVMPTAGIFHTRFDKLVFGDKVNAKNKMTFKIYYLLYK